MNWGEPLICREKLLKAKSKRLRLYFPDWKLLIFSIFLTIPLFDLLWFGIRNSILNERGIVKNSSKWFRAFRILSTLFRVAIELVESSPSMVLLLIFRRDLSEFWFLTGVFIALMLF